MLPEKDFVQINKKEIIALKSIKVVSANEIITNISEDGEHFTKLHISEVYKAILWKSLVINCLKYREPLKMKIRKKL